ncbi:MarR family winged helix-turn-helix transcriptional regulator [Photobacterium salinisoli]|uniref:MarR family winged helix-turn-helix transcriptional regulator n=1 Tax=Photobacterium salinisoli TaxID=1616783 RepID=UPI000EA3AE50|nr:MarR family transcriptional regulator [Photobacterium salinisoli]
MSIMTINGQLMIELAVRYSGMLKSIDRKLSAHGISMSEFLVLHQLYAAAEQSMSRVALAETVGLTASGVTRLLNPMEKNHLVEKEKNSRDARVSLVKLTQTGVEIYQDALVSFNHGTEAMTDRLTSAQLTQLLTLIGKLN